MTDRDRGEPTVTVTPTPLDRVLATQLIRETLGNADETDIPRIAQALARRFADGARSRDAEVRGLREACERALEAIVGHGWGGGPTAALLREVLSAPAAATPCLECEAVKAERDRLAKELTETKAESARQWTFALGVVADLGLARQERDAALADVARLTKERDNLKAAPLLTACCTFCGQELPVEGIVAATQWNREHMMVCPVHPVALLTEENRRLEGVNARLVAAWPEGCERRCVYSDSRKDCWLVWGGSGPYDTKLAAVHAAAGIDPATDKDGLTVGEGAMLKPERSDHVRDAEFHFQLGFEHGYAGLEHSYPDDLDYESGHRTGALFRSRVTELSPTITRDNKGRMGVCFQYVDWMEGYIGKREVTEPSDASPTQAERERDALLAIVCKDDDAFWCILYAASVPIYSECPQDHDPSSRLAWVRRAMGWDEEAKGDA